MDCRQLAEKHHGLLRKADRDSKAIKRLSMDKEELVWRLNQSEANLARGEPDHYEENEGSGDPTDPTGSTPDVFCASMSQLPVGPRSSFDAKTSRPKSMVMLSPTRTPLAFSPTRGMPVSPTRGGGTQGRMLPASPGRSGGALGGSRGSLVSGGDKAGSARPGGGTQGVSTGGVKMRRSPRPFSATEQRGSSDLTPREIRQSDV